MDSDSTRYSSPVVYRGVEENVHYCVLLLYSTDLVGSFQSGGMNGAREHFDRYVYTNARCSTLNVPFCNLFWNLQLCCFPFVLLSIFSPRCDT